ncbi:Cell division cycle protein [Lachnellula hyalina]|uniref:Cell division cycle protein n=1 Tax=Lachnellula hyalina TaxID=1316788 RepID=A0A8H8QVV8_9HELO|nr:Cell division cycle protein [Lachnellula hyalina]TVY23723.1 Cell division cycle protein [Lachnellula hyalina]
MSTSILIDSSEASSSPQPSAMSDTLSMGSPPRQANGQKERRNPSVTPRKFNRFFTPRSHGYRQTTASRRALNDITAPANNHNTVQSSPLRPKDSSDNQENQSPLLFERDLKRRKLVHTPDGSPERSFLSKRKGVIAGNGGKARGSSQNIPSSPCERVVRSTLYTEDIEELEELEGVEAEVYDDEDEEPFLPPKPVERIVPLSDRGLAGRLLQLSLGNSLRQHHEYPVNDWQDETSSFYSKPSDVHTCTSIESGALCIPFSVASCNTIGDEEGRVRLLESGRNGKPAFKDPYLSFRVHTNAIIDMCFTDDDTFLATASGDSTARVVDMTTQTTIGIFGNHVASLKQVRFQPGTNNKSVLATSSRDGSVQLWDLRCKGRNGPVNELSVPVQPPHRTTFRSENAKILFGIPVNGIYDAHRPLETPGQTHTNILSDAASRGDVPRRAGDVSVTAIEFLPGHDNLLLTASEADASVKLWDIRTLHSKRKAQIPLSSTAKPQTHNQWRHFGITSMNLNTDGSRLYTLCKDNTVYAYSTAHLMLGHAPELSSANNGRRAPARQTQEGLGPLYGFRHPRLQATSFYVKSAIRKAKDGKSEMLAVGSSWGAAVLFPTDERYLPKPLPSSPEHNWLATSKRASKTATGTGSRLDDESIPISTHGTPLLRGHDREVGSVAWNSDGELISVGDDFLVRVWREGGDEARDLRMGGEAEGRRWGCGWAGVGEGYDEDDD